MSTIRFPNPSDDEYDELINQLDEIPDPPTRKQKFARPNRRLLLLGSSALIASAIAGIVAYRRLLRPKNYFPLSSDFACQLTRDKGTQTGDVTFVDEVVKIGFEIRNPPKVTLPMVKSTEAWSLLFWVNFPIISQVFNSKKEESEWRRNTHSYHRPILSGNGWGVFFKNKKLVLEGTNCFSDPVAVKSLKWTLCHFSMPPTIGEITLSTSDVSDITIWDRVLSEKELAKLRAMSRDEYREWAQT